MSENDPQTRAQILQLACHIDQLVENMGKTAAIVTSAYMVLSAHSAINYACNSDEEILAEYRKCLMDARMSRTGKGGHA